MDARIIVTAICMGVSLLCFFGLLVIAIDGKRLPHVSFLLALYGSICALSPGGVLILQSLGMIP